MSAEFLVLMIATLAASGFVASQMVPLIQQTSQIAGATVTSIHLYSVNGDPRVLLTVKNTGTIDVQGVKVEVYADASTPITLAAQASPIPPGVERSFTLEGSGDVEAGEAYRVQVVCGFGGSVGEKVVYSQRLVALQW